MTERIEINDMYLENVTGGAWYNKLGNGIVNVLCVPFAAANVGLSAIVESAEYLLIKDKKDMNSTETAARVLKKTVTNLDGSPSENLREIFE